MCEGWTCGELSTETFSRGFHARNFREPEDSVNQIKGVIVFGLRGAKLQGRCFRLLQV